ncbi:FAD-dependent monooxygenase [Rhodococcus sp. BP-252]|uniref:FAD-binding domain-containing protein n=1 Tax=Rhodococcoides kyotonense TaxID=398843 RepID=A0A177YHC9_9NOCA|nr:FAD-dependent monooxygenase [Rhodococcus sp. BP-320]MBY6419768.1 FAD-dependent monooxygenase [Rhodococcus sp. BP-321]MBY6423161.1 FAD-dependent monooxygenase [Rhodococcus sp. BP-324]MBY6429727.1 FAD-dependent monooxygenase [Rhodococcus sp. BP-323]MBY6434699.1 FAD-dependent monooxygenase [Rhodococcus sp. BP-322]MBY6443542.1 FAD-dependent monooxygenase [Rhodococcus sp. BP-319]MBY6448307.1 FAD-dependent monooxygenase [Rhodococcus sp. BP-318]MBY6453248.1 FAD-dependent monooxygenase [Rhodococc
MDTVDVVVVGAGPAGCTMAGELASAGKSVVVLEKHDAVSPLSRAFGVHARTLEMLDTRARRRDDGPAMLVRPDGYVAWAGDSASGDWQPVLRRWTGQSSFSSAISGASSRVAMPPSLPWSVGPGRPPLGSSSV